MSSQQEPTSSKQRVKLTPCQKLALELSLLLNKLIVQLIQESQSLYVNTTLNNANLNKSFKQIISDFYQRQDIPKIDIFAILNSLRKMKEIHFWYDSKDWTFRFSKETSLTFGRTRIEITIESKIMMDYLYHVLGLLPVGQQDLIWVLYTPILKEKILKERIASEDILKERFVSFNIINFELTITQNFTFWWNFFGNWETERQILLNKCFTTFVHRDYLSNKLAARLQKTNPHTPESFKRCFDDNFIKGATLILGPI